MKRTPVLPLTGIAAIAALALLTRVASAQDKDAQTGDIDAKIQKAMDAADADVKNGVKVKMPEVKDTSDDDDAKEEAKEEAKKAAEAQAAVNAKGPAELPAWTPTVPQFTASGPAARKVVDGEPRIVQVGTSPLTPEALADAWDTFKKPTFSHERTGSQINDSADLSVTFRNGDDGTEVKMEVERKADGKVTHVTLSSPIALPQ